jgi:UDP-galactopyranose mutase
MYDYPIAGAGPFGAVFDAEMTDKVIFVGRLGTYRYLDTERDEAPIASERETRG